MEAKIERVENGYIVRFEDLSTRIEEKVCVFRDLKGAFERIDEFFLRCGEEGEKGSR